MREHDAEILLKIARLSIACDLGIEECDACQFLSANVPPSLTEKRGAVVSLVRKGLDSSHPGYLRGRMGHIDADEQLVNLVIRLACDSAFRDPDFPPVHADELPTLRIVITLLSPPQPIVSITDYLPGRDGIILKHGQAGAFFMPEEPVEYGWDRLTALDKLSEKAGLPETAWEDGGCGLSVFSSTTISEK